MSSGGLRFVVPGAPVPKQSFRVSGKGGYRSPRVSAWQDEVGYYARMAAQGYAPFSGPLRVEMRFHLSHRRRVDLDNLSKAVLDACNGVIYEDDKQVVELHLYKQVQPGGKSCVQVIIEEL